MTRFRDQRPQRTASARDQNIVRRVLEKHRRRNNTWFAAPPQIVVIDEVIIPEEASWSADEKEPQCKVTRAVRHFRDRTTYAVPTARLQPLPRASPSLRHI